MNFKNIQLCHFMHKFIFFLKLYNNVHTVNHNNFTFFLPVMLKVHITPLMKFLPENPCGVKRSHTKISGIRLGFSLQLSFSSSEKIQNYEVTSGNHYWAFYGGNYDKLK